MLAAVGQVAAAGRLAEPVFDRCGPLHLACADQAPGRAAARTGNVFRCQFALPPQGRRYIDGPVTTMPNGAEPAGRDVGEDGSSVRLPPRTLNPLTLPAPVPTT